MPERKTEGNQPQTAAERLADQPAYGFWLLIFAIIAVVGVFVAAITQFDKPGEIAAVMGAATGPIAALVGAWFGIRGATYAQLAASDTRSGKRDRRRGEDTDQEDH